MGRGGTARIGPLFSASGPCAAVGRAMLNGALLAIGELNDDPGSAFALDPARPTRAGATRGTRPRLGASWPTSA